MCSIIFVCVCWYCKRSSKIDVVDSSQQQIIEHQMQGYVPTHQKELELEDLEDDVGGQNSVHADTNRNSHRDIESREKQQIMSIKSPTSTNSNNSPNKEPQVGMITQNYPK